MTVQICSSIAPHHPAMTMLAGEDSHNILKALEKGKAVLQQSGSARIKEMPGNQPRSIEERLYDSRAFCKIKTAEVAMYLDPDWRTGFFSQIDSLMDCENWEDDDLPVSQDSFTTLLRLLLLIKPKRRPGLGSTSMGNIIAAWTVENDRLTIECMPKDSIRWVLSRQFHETRESAAGEIKLPRLEAALAPYNPECWFNY